MEIEPRRLMELAVHVKLLSERVLEAARNVAALEPADTPSTGVWRGAMDELIGMNVQLGLMERILRGATGAEVRQPGGRTMAGG